MFFNEIFNFNLCISRSIRVNRDAVKTTSLHFKKLIRDLPCFYLYLYSVVFISKLSFISQPAHPSPLSAQNAHVQPEW